MTEQINDTANEDKTVAILSYLTLIGWIIAFVLHGNNKTRLGSYHLRQGLGLMVLVTGFLFFNLVLAFIPFIGWLISLCTGIALFVFWLLGLMAAINGEEKPLPYVGAYFQSALKDLGK